MPAQMISYDLAKPGQDYSDLHEAIKGLGPAWWHHLDSTWIVRTSRSASKVRDALKPYLDSNDKLLVTTLSGAWASSNLPSKANKWLKNNL